MRLALLTRHVPRAECCVVASIAFSLSTFNPAAKAQNHVGAAITNIAQLRQLASENPSQSYTLQLEGNVWWARPAQGRLVLQDASDAAELEMDLLGQPVAPKQRVRIEGDGTIIKTGGRYRLGAMGAVVDNDGIHSMVERSGAVYLRAGLQPLRVDWFNGTDKYGLQIDYEGPGLRRGPISESMLRRPQVDVETGRTNLVNGLDLRAYEGNWETLPDFDKLNPIHFGTSSNFSLQAINQYEHTGLRFTGFLDIARDGLYAFHVTSDDGSMLFVGRPTIRVKICGPGVIPEASPLRIGQPLAEANACMWAELQGKVISVRADDGSGIELKLDAGGSTLKVEVVDATGLSPAWLTGRTIRAKGCCQTGHTSDGYAIPSVLLTTGAADIQDLGDSAESGRLTDSHSAQATLTTAQEVHTLKRSEALKGYPARIRGVVTCILPEHQAFTIQDQTSGLYVVDASTSLSVPAQVGEFLEVEGVTDPGLFAPLVTARSVRSLGLGHLPEPIKATWDQLLNGSLDAQYAEVEGIVLGVETNTVTLRTRAGSIKAELRLMGLDEAKGLKAYLNSLVRIRGCLFASWDYVTHHVKVGEIRLYSAEIAVEQPAPVDVFASPKKSAEDLLLFDPLATGFQRVRVSGQIVHARGPEYFMMDGNRGLRFTTAANRGLEPGALVDVVGFPELSGVSPRLGDAVVRRTGRNSLPEPKKLNSDDLLWPEHDATRVRLEGVLISSTPEQAERVLELQSGLRTFLARLRVAGHEKAPSMAVGSRVELIGTYAAEGGRRAGGREVLSFQLLLNSPADIRILSRPPWWTFRKLSIMAATLGCVLVLSVLWLTQLHRRVEERTGQLERQIRERELIERQRALEQERTRVAQDLHDELGSGLTEITMLAARAATSATAAEKRVAYVEQAGNKARELVGALDEIVWAMNPRHDSLGSLVSYLCLYAERFLGLANIAWRLNGSTSPPEQILDGRLRHQLFLAFKESLTNVVRHSNATEVTLSIKVDGGRLCLSVADNGCGLSTKLTPEANDGLANMRARIEKLAGSLEVSSGPGGGTAVQMCVPCP
jgi:signal transduction histidine kinase